MKTKSFNRCYSCSQWIEDGPLEFSEPYDHEPDGSYRVTLLNPEVPCTECGDPMGTLT
jgi:hypothetical protein